MKKILITGATGFVSRNQVRQLATNKEYDVTCVVRFPEKAREILPQVVTILSCELYTATKEALNPIVDYYAANGN